LVVPTHALGGHKRPMRPDRRRDREVWVGALNAGALRDLVAEHLGVVA
jgi:hypothetical protein